MNKTRGIGLSSFFAFTLTLLLSTVSAVADQLEWTNPEGKSVTGEFVRMDSKSVMIRTEAGREIEIPLSSLSFESHLQAIKLAKPEAFTKELVKAPEVIQPVKLSAQVPLGSVVDSPFGDDPTIDEFLRIAIGEWKRGNNFVVWHMLPPRMQQDVQRLALQNIQALGPTGLNQVRTFVSLMASLAAKKRDWIVESDLAALFPIQVDSPQSVEQWPIMVGMLEKLSDKSLWDSSNFQTQSIVPWLATMFELLLYVREMSGELNDISTNVVSQSAERAEVEVTIGSRETVTYQFQKVGNIWVVPEIMNDLRARVDEQLSGSAGQQLSNVVMTVLPLAVPVMTQLDQAKTRDEFDSIVKFPLLSQFLSQLPKTPADQGPLKGLPPLPGIPSLLFGLPSGTL